MVRTATSGSDERFMQKNSKMCMCPTSISQATVSKLNTDLILWMETLERGHWRKMLSDNFSTEGPCKGTHYKRTAHRKERKEVAISSSVILFICKNIFSRQNCRWLDLVNIISAQEIEGPRWTTGLEFQGKNLGSSWPLSFQVWSPAQAF